MDNHHKKNNRLLGFLHNHPFEEEECGIDKDHVIVDKADWLQVQELKLNFLCCICSEPIDIRINFLSEFGEDLHPENSNWICDRCKKALQKKH